MKKCLCVCTCIHTLLHACMHTYIHTYTIPGDMLQQQGLFSRKSPYTKRNQDSEQNDHSDSSDIKVVDDGQHEKRNQARMGMLGLEPTTHPLSHKLMMPPRNVSLRRGTTALDGSLNDIIRGVEIKSDLDDGETQIQNLVAGKERNDHLDAVKNDNDGDDDSDLCSTDPVCAHT